MRCAPRTAEVGATRHRRRRDGYIDFGMILAAENVGTEVAQGLQPRLDDNPAPPFDPGSIVALSQTSFFAARGSL